MKFSEERPTIAEARSQYIYYPNTQMVPGNAAANVLNRSHSIAAKVVIPDDGAQGVLISHGGNDGGYSFYMQDNKLHYVHNYVAQKYFHVVSTETVTAGAHELRYEFEVTGDADPLHGKGAPGRGQLYIDEKLVGQLDMPISLYAWTNCCLVIVRMCQLGRRHCTYV